MSKQALVKILPREPSMLDAFLPVISLVALLATAVIYFGNDSSYGPNQIALLIAMGITIIIGIKNGHKWHDIEKAIINGISLSLGTVLILLAVGSLIGTWLISGTVPTMIYYGLHPSRIKPYARRFRYNNLTAYSVEHLWRIYV